MKKILSALGIGLPFFVYSFAYRSQSSQTIEPKQIPQTPVSADTPQQKAPDISPGTTSQVLQTPTASKQWKDGLYIGDAIDVFYGNVQVQATIAGGALSNVEFLQYPSDRGNSRELSMYAIPLLTQEAIQSQSANVDTISGATQTSRGFIQSLQSALQKAR